MKTDYERYADTKGSHAYDVYVYEDLHCYDTKNFSQMIFKVFANNRNVAANRVIRDGFYVCSVNMTG